MLVKHFEKELIRQLCEQDIATELLDNMLDDKADQYEYTGAGYYLTFNNKMLPATRKIYNRPLLIGESKGIQAGFIVFIEKHQLVLECHAWDDTTIPDDFRERLITIKAINITTRFDIKKPPKGWMFPFSKNNIRGFIKQLPDVNFDHVVFKGTYKPVLVDLQWFCFGILQSERIEGEWVFSLLINCLKSEHVLPWKEDIPKRVLAEVKQWIEKKIALPITAPEKPTQLFLKYEIKQGVCISSCFEVD